MSLTASLDGAQRLQQMMSGLPDVATRAMDMGMPTEVERLEEGLAAFNKLLGQAAVFQDEVDRLGQMWKSSELSTLVEQNRAWLKLVKKPYHGGQDHMGTTRRAVGTTAAAGNEGSYAQVTGRHPADGALSRSGRSMHNVTNLYPDNKNSETEVLPDESVLTHPSPKGEV